MFKDGLWTCKLNGCVYWVLVDKLVNWKNKKIYVGCIIVVKKCEIVSKWELKIWRKFKIIFEIQINSMKKDVDVF